MSGSLIQTFLGFSECLIWATSGLVPDAATLSRCQFIAVSQSIEVKEVMVRTTRANRYVLLKRTVSCDQDRQGNYERERQYLPGT